MKSSFIKIAILLAVITLSGASSAQIIATGQLNSFHLSFSLTSDESFVFDKSDSATVMMGSGSIGSHVLSFNATDIDVHIDPVTAIAGPPDTSIYGIRLDNFFDFSNSGTSANIPIDWSADYSLLALHNISVSHVFIQLTATDLATGRLYFSDQLVSDFAFNDDSFSVKTGGNFLLPVGAGGETELKIRTVVSAGATVPEPGVLVFGALLSLGSVCLWRVRAKIRVSIH